MILVDDAQIARQSIAGLRYQLGVVLNGCFIKPYSVDDGISWQY